MLDYRMYSGGAVANVDVINQIKKELRNAGLTVNNPFKFVGFEGAAGTKFRLNDQTKEIAIPSCGHFVTPFCETMYMPVSKLIFSENFAGDIYYII